MEVIKMKKMFFPLVFILLLTLVLGACAAPPAAPTTAPSEQPTPAPVEAKTITLKFAYDMPKLSPLGIGFDWFAAELEKRTDGKVKVDIYPGQSLFKQAEAVNSVLAGVADIATGSISANQKVFAINRVFTLPSVYFPDTEAGHMARREAATKMYEKYPALSDELKPFKLMFWSTNPAYTFITKNKKVVVPDDLKGLKIASLGLDMEIVKLAGGSPVFVIPPEVYMNMDKNVVDGALVGWFMVKNEHFEEVAPYWLDYGFGQNTQFSLMNLDSWNSLPPDIQKILTDLAPETEQRVAVTYLASVKEGREIVTAKGCEITPLTAEQRQLWLNLTKPLDEVWVNSAKESGVTNAQEILDSLKQLSAEAWK